MSTIYSKHACSINTNFSCSQQPWTTLLFHHCWTILQKGWTILLVQQCCSRMITMFKHIVQATTLHITTQSESVVYRSRGPMFNSRPETLKLHFSQLVPVESENAYLSETRYIDTSWICFNANETIVLWFYGALHCQNSMNAEFSCKLSTVPTNTLRNRT